MYDDAISKVRSRLIYNTRYRILICRPCRHVVHHDALQRHLQRVHRDWDRTTRGHLVDYAKTLELMSIDQVHVLCPGPVMGPGRLISETDR